MNGLVRKTQVFCKKNGSTILTYVGGMGVVATTFMAVKATPKAIKILEVEQEKKGEELTDIEVVKAVASTYIPTLVVATGTIACIFGANILNKKHQAALTSAYVLLDNSFKEYKNKLKELHGEETHRNIITNIAKDRYDDENLSGLDIDDGKILFYDEYYGRYFEAKREDVIKAEYDLNRQMFTTGGASLNDFYQSLINSGVNINLYPGGDELGWSSGILESHYWASWIEFDHYDTEMDNMNCTVIAMRCAPVIDYAYY